MKFCYGPIHFVALLLAAPTTTEGYLPTVRPSRCAFALYSSTSVRSSEADFSAFADSLDMDDDQVASTSSSSVTTSSTAFEKPWQAKLEELLDPMTSGAQRQILLSELLNANEKIRESVMDALTNRRIDPLLTPTQRKLQDGTRAVVRQLANDILPQIQKSAEAVSPMGSGRSFSSPLSPFTPPSPSDIESIGNRLFSVVSNQIEKNLKELQDDLSDPLNKIPQRLEKQRTEVLQEARNVFLETPEGLEEPPYTVVETCDLYEIRDYDGYSVASTAVSTTSDSASMEGVANGQAFNLLAAYLFGGNEAQKQMSMTTPVTTTSSGEMRFYLAPMPGGFPAPAVSKSGASTTDSNVAVDIVEVPPARLAIRKFTGFVTDGEVARQKDTLLQALEMDGVELDVPHGAVVPHVVFQYNPPYTLPIVRRNEIAVPVRKVQDGTDPITRLKEEWNVDVDEDATDSYVNGLDDVSPSD
ncbi:SOUL heme-binding domain containing protein [Nitzschia inconspicua]|uniref:SOUL heme-binding domain containing protein n=1 Tax=Nitzschia inconspicua TaxID=303405 RepID=A0A9K3Q8E3_9STRA|nr:SOUL heme-binding domain containing protein [Nitzschia inconspicua]